MEQQTELAKALETARSGQKESAATQEVRSILSACRDLVAYVERNHCVHEETRREGVIWETCTQCGMSWADDRGGKPEDAHELPSELERARNILAQYVI